MSLLSVMLAAFVAMPWWVTKLMNSFRAELSAQIGALSKDVAGVGTEVAVLKNDVTRLKDDVAVLQKDMTGLKDDMAVLKNDVAVLQKDMTGLHERMDRVEARLPEPPAPAAD